MDRAAGSLNLPPGPRRPYPLQTLAWIRNPVPFLEHCRREFGPIFVARFGPTQRAVFVSDLDAIRNALAGDGQDVRMGDANGLFRPAVGPSSILLLDGEEHLRHRRLMMPAFRRGHAQLFAGAIEAAAEERVARWVPGTRVRLQPELEQIAFTSILAIVFGLDRSGPAERIRELFPRMMDLCDRPVNLLPWFRLELGGFAPWGRLMAIIRELDEVIREQIRQRRNDPDVELRDDLLSMLCRARQADGTPMTESELRDELMTMLMAGQETTSAALAWVFERLVNHPRAMDRVVAELDDPASDLEYVNAAIKETLRQRPPIPVMARMVRSPLELGGYDIPPGWVVMPAIHLLHREPSIYPRADEFLPERFLVAPPPRGAWLPFGGGIRHCLGAHVAELEMRIVLRAVLTRLRLRPANGPEPIRRRRFAFSPADDASVFVELRQRPRLRRLAGDRRDDQAVRTASIHVAKVEPRSKPSTKSR